REAHRPGVAIRFAEGVVEARAALAQVVDGREGRVVLVGPASGWPQRAGLRRAADDQRRVRLLNGTRKGREAAELVVTALEVELLLRPRERHDLELLREHGDALARGRE